MLLYIIRTTTGLKRDHIFGPSIDAPKIFPGACLAHTKILAWRHLWNIYYRFRDIAAYW